MQLNESSEKNEIKKQSPADAEIATLEVDEDLKERALLTKIFFEELREQDKDGFSRKDLKNDLPRQIDNDHETKLEYLNLNNTKNAPIERYHLPEMYRDGQYFESGQHIFARVGQGNIWLLPKSRNPYFQVSMSECSTIVASTKNYFIVAHASFSEINQIKPMMKFLKDNGVDAKNIYIIASTGKQQAKLARRSGIKRAYNKNYYAVNYQIPKKNIMTFRYKNIYNEKEKTKVEKNITQVIGCNDSLFIYTCDMKIEPRSSWNGPKEVMIGDYKKIETITLS